MSPSLQWSQRRTVSNAENAPPLRNKQSKLVSYSRNLQATASRRRARVVSGHKPYQIVEPTKRRKLSKAKPLTEARPDSGRKLKFEIQDVSVEEKPSSTPMNSAPVPPIPSSVSLPRWLARPELKAISMQDIFRNADISVPQEDTTMQPAYFRELLREVGPSCLKVLSGVRTSPVHEALPSELSVTLQDFGSEGTSRGAMPPTHVLALYSRNPSPSACRKRVMLYPIHSVMLAAHCANLQAFPPSSASSAEPPKAGEAFSLPVVPLCIPSPEMWTPLASYLYTKRVDLLLPHLLRATPPPQAMALLASLRAVDEDDEKSVLIRQTIMQRYAAQLSSQLSPKSLLVQVMAVNGLWRNACALGICDEDLWAAMDLAWEVLLGALGMLTGQNIWVSTDDEPEVKPQVPRRISCARKPIPEVNSH